jgi:VWFA-related protein
MTTRPLVRAAALLAALPLFAQQSAPTPLSARVDLKIINVDVAVLDADGKPVGDLTSGDFEIFEDNQPQKVTNFLVVDNSAKGAAARTTADLQFRRRLILLVDNNYLDKRERNLALDKLDTFIDDTFDSAYDWAVASIGQQLDVLQPFTTDKTQIHEAVAKIRKLAVSSFRGDMDDRSMLSDPLHSSQRPGSTDINMAFEGRERATRNARALANTARGIVEAARAFATSDGKKVAVLLTGAMDMNSGYGAYEQSSDREMQDLKTAVARMIESTVREANLSNMTIHVLNTATFQTSALQHDIANASSGLILRGNMAATRLGSSADTSDTSTPFRIAQGTGGLYLSHDVRQSLDAINATSSRFYLLGYSPPHGDDRQYHRITVKVKRPGLRTTHRQGYLDLSEEERLEQLLKLRVSLLQPATAMPVSLNVASAGGGDPQPVMTVVAAMPMSRVTLLESEGSFVGRVHVYLSIFDAHGKNVGFHHQTQDVKLTAAQKSQAIADAFRYRMNVRLARGEFTVAVTLRDDLSNDVGTAIKNVHF